MKKSELKKQLNHLGIKVVGNYVSKKEVIKVLAGKVLQFPYKKAEWGFDLTSIRPEIWRKILKFIGASEKPGRDDSSAGWVWKGKTVTIYTGNDPISGEYYRAGAREIEKGYASYIGIEGDKETVKKVADIIRKKADYIKEESPEERQFI